MTSFAIGVLIAALLAMIATVALAEPGDWRDWLLIEIPMAILISLLILAKVFLGWA